MSQILKSVLVYERCIGCILYATVFHIVSMLENLELIIFLQECKEKNSYTLQPMESNYNKHANVETVLSIKVTYDMLLRAGGIFFL